MAVVACSSNVAVVFVEHSCYSMVAVGTAANRDAYFGQSGLHLFDQSLRFYHGIASLGLHHRTSYRQFDWD